MLIVVVNKTIFQFIKTALILKLLLLYIKRKGVADATAAGLMNGRR